MKTLYLPWTITRSPGLMPWRSKVPLVQCWWDPLLSWVKWDPGFLFFFQAFCPTAQISPELLPWARRLLGSGLYNSSFTLGNGEDSSMHVSGSVLQSQRQTSPCVLYVSLHIGQNHAISDLEPTTGNRNNFNRRKENTWSESNLLR